VSSVTSAFVICVQVAAATFTVSLRGAMLFS
jgi:hypothetical protein